MLDWLVNIDQYEWSPMCKCASVHDKVNEEGRGARRK